MRPPGREGPSMTTVPNWYRGFHPRPKPVRTSARQLVTGSPRLERSRQLAEEGLLQPFMGLTADGVIEPALFPLQPGTANTNRLCEAAQALLVALSPEQRADATFPVDSPL